MRLSWKRALGVAAGFAMAVGLVLLFMPTPRAVDVAPVLTGPMQVTVDDQGETRSHDRLVVSAPVAGRLMRIELHDGDAVREGQLLARIAPLPLSSREREETSARVASAQAVQREVEQLVRRGEEDLAQARREHERVRKLVQEGFISPQSVEQARNAEVSAASEVVAARFRARAAAADVRVAQSGLGALRATGAGALVEVRSPMTVSILRIPDPSERVVAAGTPLMMLGDLGALEVVVELLSSEAVRVAADMPVHIEGWGGDRSLRGKVRRVESFAVTKVSALGIEEKRVNAVVDFVDPPGAIGDGYRVTARIVTWQRERVLKVPASALFRCDSAWCVFVVDGGRARRSPIEIGQRNLLEAEVKSGLVQDQSVILYPSNELADGARVRAR
jgi:HlyD family secretion protein